MAETRIWREDAHAYERMAGGWRSYSMLQIDPTPRVPVTTMRAVMNKALNQISAALGERGLLLMVDVDGNYSIEEKDRG